MDLEDKGACLDQVRIDLQTIRASIEDMNRTAGVILAANGVLLALYLNLIFSTIKSVTNSNELRLGDLIGFFPPNFTAPLIESNSMILFLAPIFFSGFSGLICLIAFLDNVDMIHRPKRLLDWRCRLSEKMLQVHTITALLYLETYYLESLSLQKEKVAYKYSSGLYTFYFALACSMISAYAAAKGGITDRLLIYIIISLYMIFTGYAIGKVAKSYPRFNQSLKNGEERLAGLERIVRERHIL
ncbi:MAG: hypothetical protein ABFC89_00645 [Methanospirillum sp.]